MRWSRRWQRAATSWTFTPVNFFQSGRWMLSERALRTCMLAVTHAQSSMSNRMTTESCICAMHRWFDLVAVLQTDNSILYERLAARGYPQVTAVCMVLW
jgi:hypothetical protein